HFITTNYALLVKLNEIGTVRGTAKAILISQLAVSQRLKFIEEYFGETIFIRISKRLKVTPSDDVILKNAKKVVERIHNVKIRISASSVEVKITLSISCSSLISQRYLPKILAKFTKEYPLVTVDLVTGMSEDIKQNKKNYHVSIIRGDKI